MRNESSTRKLALLWEQVWVGYTFGLKSSLLLICTWAEVSHQFWGEINLNIYTENCPLSTTHIRALNSTGGQEKLEARMAD